MRRGEYEALNAPEPTAAVVNLVAPLQNRRDRTLIWGYTTARDSFHVYLQDETIFRIVYGRDWAEAIRGQHFLPSRLVPNKRVYPEASDFEFCKLLMSHGVEIPFTTFNADRPAKTFHGKLAEELVNVEWER